MSTKAPLKLYISGPITGFAEGNRQTFDAVKNYLLSIECEAISPFDIDATLTVGYDSTYWKIIGKDLEILHSVDGVVLLPGWYRSVGARIEVLAGLLSKKKFYEYIPESIHKVYDVDSGYIANELRDSIAA